MVLIFFFLFGLVFGSFYNVLIDRMPNGENIWKGRSHCDHCKRTLNWYELIPLFSFLLQNGKSICCHKRLSWQYPLIEFITGLLFIYAYLIGFGNPWQIFSNIIILSAFLVNFIVDLKYQILLDSMIIAVGIGAIIRLAIASLFITQWIPFILSGIGACVFFFILWLGTRGRGMGFGDVKLSLVLGLLLGYPGIIYALYIAFLTGAVFGVILVIAGIKKLKSHVAFGPFLIAGSIISLQFGANLSSWLKGIIW
jgi:leader peptidase (prepilin peptidase) / N-methyltransferase